MQQRPPQPPAGQQPLYGNPNAPRPMGGQPPQGFAPRPAGTPPLHDVHSPQQYQGQSRPAQPTSPTGQLPPSYQSSNAMRPGFPPQPNPTLAQPFSPGRPPMHQPAGQRGLAVRPAGDMGPNAIDRGALSGSVSPPGVSGAGAPGARPPNAPHTLNPAVPDTGMRQGNAPTPVNAPMVPTPDTSASHAAADAHHRRKRMYPQQISNAYLEQPESTPMGYSAPTTPQQPQFAPASGPEAYGAQQFHGQSPAYGQPTVNSVTNQFANMGINSTFPTPQAVPLTGVRPQIAELLAPWPQPRLPPNVSVTDSPYVNCDPSYKCCTLNMVPTTEQLLKKSRLPFALVLSPFRTVKDGEDPVPVIRDSVIARCRRCRTYINPFVSFVEGGQRWKCNMCSLLNDVPAAFDYDPLTQQPADRWKRAELNYGCVDFVAPTEYMVRPPQAPAYVIIIDVSYSAIQSGMLATAARTILDSLDRIPNKENRTTVAFIAIDSALHFFRLNAGVTEPQMLVVSDLEDVFLPQPSDLLANLTESMGAIKALLEKLPDMFKDNVNVHNALGSALQAAFKLISPCGGKIICLQSTLPNVGPGILKPREDVKLLGTAKETTLLNAASPFYKSFAVDCSRSQVACDMVIFGSQYSDVATLNCLPHYTGGQTYYYPGFNASRTEDALKFAHEFSELLAEEIGLEAVIRIRATRGLRMNAFHGNFFIRSTDLLALPNVPRNQSYCVEVVIEDDLKGPTVCFQTALLHTSCNGERRIRVVTLCIPTSTSMSELYNHANQMALAAYFANKGIERALSSKLDDARDAIVNKIVDILGIYKAHVLGSGPGSVPQLTAPNNLKLLPLLGLCLLKHDGLRQSSQIPTDLRSNAMNLLRTMPLQLLLPYLYPNFYSLHNLPPEAGEIGENGVILPPALNLTAENLEPHGCYLLENGQNIYLWVGRGVVPQLCADLFDVKSYEGLKGGKFMLPSVDTPINKKVNLIIGKIREMRRGNYYPTLYLVKEDGDPYLRMWFLAHLIEDRTDSIMSYQEFLQRLKDRVGSGSF